MFLGFRLNTGLIPTVVLAGVAGCFFFGNPTLFRRLRVRHILAIHAQHPAAVYRTLEPAQRTVDVFFVADFNANSYMVGQDKFLR